MVSSESAVCSAVSAQSLCRPPRQYLRLSYGFPACFRREVLLCSLVCRSAQQRLSCSKYTLYRQLVIFGQAIIACRAASVGTFGRFSGNTIIVPGVGCYETYTAETSIRLGLAWVALFVFDLLIFTLTMYKICKTRGLLRLSLVTRRNVIDTVFHDGAMYFGAMTLSNIPNILTYYVDSGMMSGTLGAFTSCLTVITTRVNVQSAISSTNGRLVIDSIPGCEVAEILVWRGTAGILDDAALVPAHFM
ncbi:hypothetical protein BDR03DRAFT_176296 [Suillus americanus]|nr:hypothetical protein BDR03DRAFT_176296 [Suillus americanus]